ncbi:MAG TPA: glucoamylase family protein [Ktedonobacteraceae bacterium]|nr:glucoamylase family protein [Ktedonobacteraceae bacterium]
MPGVDPQDAFANIQALRSRYNIYDRYGFFDAVNPLTGQVGHRYLVLDQSMIMAALDNALRGNLMQQHFAADPVIAAARPYLSMEPVLYPVARYASTMSKTPMVRNLW